MNLGPDVTLSPTIFADRTALTFPTRAGSLVLATRGYQLTPFRLLLPHQVYSHDVEALLASPGVQEVWALEVVTPWRLLAAR